MSKHITIPYKLKRRKSGSYLLSATFWEADTRAHRLFVVGDTVGGLEEKVYRHVVGQILRTAVKRVAIDDYWGDVCVPRYRSIGSQVLKLPKRPLKRYAKRCEAWSERMLEVPKERRPKLDWVKYLYADRFPTSYVKVLQNCKRKDLI